MLHSHLSPIWMYVRLQQDWLYPHAGKRASSPLLIEAEEEDETGGTGSKSEMRDLEDRLMHRFTPDFPWDAFEAAATKLKVITGMGLAFACPHSCTCEVLYL